MMQRDDPAREQRNASQRRPPRDREGAELERMLAPDERTPRALPYRERMEELFRAELTSVRAYLGAKETLAPTGARAAADGELVAFADAQPTPGLVAHEVTHVLQSRGGVAGGDAESEAARNQATVERGDNRVEVAASAHGLQFDAGGYAYWDASIFDGYHDYLASSIRDRLEKLAVLDTSPWGKYVTAGDQDRATANWFFVRMLVPALGLGPDNPYPSTHLAELVEPESLDALVSRGAGGAIATSGSVAGLGASDAVLWEVANALARRVPESLPRVLPYVARLKQPALYADVDTSAVPAKHPMDRAVAAALGSWHLMIDPSFYVNHKEPLPVLPAPSRQTIQLVPAGVGLWHWVVADPQDATAAEVALAMFGNADLQHRLAPNPPYWGFHHADLARMKPALREQINQFAAKHHPHPAMLNYAEVLSHREPVPVNRPRYDRCGQIAKDPRFDVGHTLGWDRMVEPPPPAPIYGLPRGVDDPVLELTRAGRTPLPATAPPATQGKAPAEQHDELELSERLADADRLLGQILDGTRILGLATDTVQEVRDWLRERRAYALKKFLGSHVDKWYRLTSQQIPILRSAAYGFSGLLLQLAAYAPVNVGAARPGDDLINKLPEFTRGPLQEAGRAYVEATQAIDLPAVARERVRYGNQLARNVTIETLERGLHVAEHANDAVVFGAKGPDAQFIDPFKQLTNATETTARLAKLRVLQVTDPAAAQAELAALRQEVGDFQFTTAIEQAVTQLDSYWNALDQANDFWTTLADTVRTRMLKDENRGFYRSFHIVYALYTLPEDQGGGKAMKKVARDLFKYLVTGPRWQKHFEEVQQLIKDEQSHARWAKLVTAIVICIASLAIGGEVGLFVVEELGWSAGAATLATVAADTATNMYLSYTVLGVKPTTGSIVSQFITFGGMAALQRVRAVARAAGIAEEAEGAIKASFLVRAGRASVDFAKEAFINVAVGQAATMLGNRIDTGSWIDAENAPESMVDGAITAVALVFAGRLHGKIMEPRYRAAAKGFGVDLDGVYHERKKLIDEATKLKGSTDREAALDVVDRMNENLRREEELQKRLATIAKVQPEAFKRAMGDLSEMKQTRANLREIETAQVTLGVEDLGPGLARADSSILDALLAKHRESGGRLVKVETDPNTNLRTLTVEDANGGRIEIREKPLPASERKPPRLATDTARQFERWLDDPTLDPIAAQRLRDLYVVDPEAAVALAGDHGYTGPQPEHPIDEAAHARDAARKLDDPQIREMTTPDFTALERAGYRYDPVSRRFVPTAMKSGIHPDEHLAGRVNRVIGKPLPSEAVGHQVLQLLSMGDAHALRVVGIEPPPGFESSSGEWGLGRRASDGVLVLVRGEAMGVQWSDMPGIEPLAHSHPFRDNKYYQIGGKPGGSVALADLIAGQHPNDTLKLFPSGADFVFCAAHGLDSHFVVTPYVNLGNGRIGNPRPGGLETPITIEIRSAKGAGAEKATGAPTATAEVVLRAGDKVLMRRQMWGGELGHYMPVRFNEPADLVPASALGGKPGSTLGPAPIDVEQIHRIANREDLDPKLKAEIETDPRVQRALHSEGYDEQPVLDAWRDYSKRRTPSQALKSETFGEYLKHRHDFHTAVGGPPLTVEETFPKWHEMRYDERQWAIVRRAEPALADALEKRRGGLPSKIRKAIRNVLDNEDVVGGEKRWDNARHEVMKRIDDIVTTMSRNPGELATVLGKVHASGRIGMLGEQYVEHHLTDPGYVATDLVKPSFSASEIPGLSGVKLFVPDRIVREAHRSLDIKTGYGDTKIDLTQAKNYESLIDASRTNADLATRLGGALEGHDYLFVPGGTEDPRVVAATQYEFLENAQLDMTRTFRCLYVGDDGGIYQYRPSGDINLGKTIHQAMYLPPSTP